MSHSSRKIEILADAGVGLLVARAALPIVLTWLANLAIRKKLPGYRGKVQRVDFHFADPSLVVEGLSFAKSTGSHELLNIGSLIFGSNWKTIFTGALVGYIQVDAPRLQLNFQSFLRNGGPKAKQERTSKTDPNQRPWQEKVKRSPAFRFTSAVLTNGEIQLLGVRGQDETDVRIDRLNLYLDNVTNSTELAPTSMAVATCTARVMATGSLELRAQGYPLAQAPTFKLDFQTRNIDLTEVRTIIEQNVEVDVRRGTVDLYVEAAAADGQIQGYAKPIFDHLELETPKHTSFIGKMKAWTAEAVAKLGRNKRKDRIATRIGFEGSFQDPDLNIIDAILAFIRNGFITAERASLEWDPLESTCRHASLSIL